MDSNVSFEYLTGKRVFNAGSAQKTALKAAEEGIVLLKNENSALPLPAGAKVAFFGRMQKHYIMLGTGSGGRVTPPFVTNIFDSLKELGAEPDAAVEAFEEGLELGAMEEIEVSEAFLLEFVEGHFFVDVEDDAAEVEDDISDFFAHFKKKVVFLQINSGPIAQLVRATDS